jgi:predicted dehydrogenase
MASVYDPNADAARVTAERLGARVVDSHDVIFADPDIDVALVYTPPFTRLELVGKAVAAGKEVITTKPLAPTLAEAQAIADLTRNGRCLVIYKRTGSPQVRTLKKVLDSGEVGALASQARLIHHFLPRPGPRSQKNGGPRRRLIHNSTPPASSRAAVWATASRAPPHPGLRDPTPASWC